MRVVPQLDKVSSTQEEQPTRDSVAPVAMKSARIRGVEGDRDREVETNDDSDGQAVQQDDRNDETETRTGN